MCGTNSTLYFGHCLGCQCFPKPSYTWTTTGPVVHTTPYQPKHRKPGPAQ